MNIRHGGNVKRHHNYPILGEQRVASHSWGVAILLEKVHPEIFYNSPDAVAFTLYHDVAEYKTGDVPKNAKIKRPDLSEALKHLESEVHQQLGIKYVLSPKERSAISICDGLELMFFCIEQRLLGNQYAIRVFDTIAQHLMQKNLEDSEKDVFWDLMGAHGSISSGQYWQSIREIEEED